MLGFSSRTKTNTERLRPPPDEAPHPRAAAHRRAPQARPHVRDDRRVQLHLVLRLQLLGVLPSDPRQDQLPHRGALPRGHMRERPVRTGPGTAADEQQQGTVEGAEERLGELGRGGQGEVPRARLPVREAEPRLRPDRERPAEASHARRRPDLLGRRAHRVVRASDRGRRRRRRLPRLGAYLRPGLEGDHRRHEGTRTEAKRLPPAVRLGARSGLDRPPPPQPGPSIGSDEDIRQAPSGTEEDHSLDQPGRDEHNRRGRCLRRRSGTLEGDDLLGTHEHRESRDVLGLEVKRAAEAGEIRTVQAWEVLQVVH